MQIINDWAPVAITFLGAGTPEATAVNEFNADVELLPNIKLPPAPHP